MKPYGASMPAVAPPSAGAVLSHDLRCALTASVAGAALALLFVGIVAMAVRDWSWTWLAWTIAGAAVPWAVLFVGAIVELVRSMLERIMQIDINRDGYIGGAPEPAGEPFRLIVAKSPTTRQAEQDTDRHWVIHRAYAVGLGFRQWRGVTLPSGRKIDEMFWQSFLSQLTDAGMIEPGRPGQSARWLTDEATVLSRFV